MSAADASNLLSCAPSLQKGDDPVVAALGREVGRWKCPGCLRLAWTDAQTCRGEEADLI